MDIFLDSHWGRMPVHKAHIAELVAHERPANRDDQVDRANLAYRRNTGCNLYHDCLTCAVSETKCARYE